MNGRRDACFRATGRTYTFIKLWTTPTPCRSKVDGCRLYRGREALPSLVEVLCAELAVVDQGNVMWGTASAGGWHAFEEDCLGDP